VSYHRLLSAFAALLFLSGFAHASDKIKQPKPPKPPKIPKEWYDPKKLAKRVEYLNSDLKKAISVEQITTSTTINSTQIQLIGISAILRNRTQRDTTFLIQTVFKDKNGKELKADPDKPEEWTTLLIPGKGTTTYEAQASSDKAMRFSMRLKPLTKPRL